MREVNLSSGGGVHGAAPDAVCPRLQIGESATAVVRAGERWNHMSVFVEPGERYAFEVSPPDQVWKDWWVRTTADGFTRAHLRLLERWRRVPAAAWFALVGTVGESLEEAFVIGTGTARSMGRAGELLGFANDLSCMYWNNHGSIRVSIQRLE